MRDIQRLKIASAKPSQRRILAAELCLQNLYISTQLVAQIFSELTVDCFHFSLHAILAKERCFEKFSEYFKSLLKLVILNLKVKLCSVL